ncbi:hypothetical protein F8D90_02835, partial [Mycobacterium tuberculosis]
TTLNARDQPPAEVSDQRVSGLTGAVQRKVSQTPGDPEQTTATRRLSHRHTHLAAHTTPTLRHKGPFSHGVSRAFASGGR